MMIPETKPGHSGFVAQPQPQGHPLAGLTLRKVAEKTRIQYLGSEIAELAAEVRTFCKDRAVFAMLKELEAEKMRQGYPFSCSKKHPLSSIFNKLVMKNPEQEKFLKSYLYPMLKSVMMKMRNLFEMIDRLGNNYEHRKALIAIYQQSEFAYLRRTLDKFPTPEFADFYNDCKNFDATIQRLGGNNGTPPKNSSLAA